MKRFPVLYQLVVDRSFRYIIAKYGHKKSLSLRESNEARLFSDLFMVEMSSINPLLSQAIGTNLGIIFHSANKKAHRLGRA